MAKIFNYGKEVSIEEYIRQQVAVNDGASTPYSKMLLCEILDNLNINHKVSATKNELLDLILDHFNDLEKSAEVLGIGVKVNHYTAAFDFITINDIKRFEKYNALKVIGKQQFRSFGKYRYATLYDLIQFSNMTDADMREMLKKYPGRTK